MSDKVLTDVELDELASRSSEMSLEWDGCNFSGGVYDVVSQDVPALVAALREARAVIRDAYSTRGGVDRLRFRLDVNPEDKHSLWVLHALGETV